jgi:hypothetical protein
MCLKDHVCKLEYLEMQPVTMISGSMSQEDIVSDNVWFSG